MHHTKAELARWASLLVEHDFELRHRPGHKNAVAGTLSQYPLLTPIQHGFNASSAVLIHTLPPVSMSAYPVTVLRLALYHSMPFTLTISASFRLALSLATADTDYFSSATAGPPSAPSQTEESFNRIQDTRVYQSITHALARTNPYVKLGTLYSSGRTYHVEYVNTVWSIR